MANGWSDLVLYDLKTRQATRLEHDHYAHLQPAWSPDGHSLAFVTDSGPQTNFDLLQFGPMQIAVMDMTNPDHPSRLLQLFGGRAKHINPQFSPDGQTLFFVADPDGIPDIYRLTWQLMRITRVTRVATGVTGLTYESAALSVARRPGASWSTCFRARDRATSSTVSRPTKPPALA